jgi:hypothetical protein
LQHSAGVMTVLTPLLARNLLSLRCTPRVVLAASCLSEGLRSDEATTYPIPTLTK